MMNCSVPMWYSEKSEYISVIDVLMPWLCWQANHQLTAVRSACKQENSDCHCNPTYMAFRCGGKRSEEVHKAWQVKPPDTNLKLTPAAPSTRPVLCCGV